MVYRLVPVRTKYVLQVMIPDDIGKMIEYLLRQDDGKGFTSLIQRKAITEYYILNDKIKKNTASCRITSSRQKTARALLESTAGYLGA